jgi:hypothetical protein
MIHKGHEAHKVTQAELLFDSPFVVTRAFSKSTLKPNLATNCANVTNFFVLFVTFVAALEAQRRNRRTLRTPYCGDGFELKAQ